MSESIEQVRAKAAVIVARMKADGAFKAQIEQHPEETLVAAGLPANAVSDFLAELQAETSEVSGYLAVDCSYTCTSTSCTFTL
jgi:hypothetical protein